MQKSELHEAINASFPRNRTAAVAWDAIWGFGAACCLLYAVVPAYLLAMGASKMLVQTVMVGFSLAVGLQLLSIRFSHSPHRKLRIYLVWSLFPACWLIYGIIASMGWGRMSNSVWIPLFVVMCACLAVIMNLGFPAYSEMLLENTPLKKRGGFSAIRCFALGVFGVIGVLLASWLMKQWPQPVNFHHSFIIGPSIMFIACVSILFMRDNAGIMRSYSAQPFPVLKTAKKLLDTFNFRVFLFFYGCIVVSLSMGPLLIGYGKDILNMTPSHVTQFSFVYFFSAIAVGILVLPHADRYGFRLIAIISAVMLTGAFFCPLAAGDSRYALLAGYLLYVGAIYLNMFILANLGAELVPDVKPAAIIAIGSLLVVPFSLVIAPLAGRFVDLHNKSGYIAVFLVGMTLSLCALVGFCFLVREPRTGQEIYIRIRRT